MNKKIFAIVAVLLVAVLAVAGLTACNKFDILAVYNKIGNAKTASQTISVKDGNTEVASATLNYNFTAKTLTGERQYLNDLSAAETWTTKTVNETISGGATAKLTKENVKDLVVTDHSATCKVSGDSVKNVFGINATDVKGDVSLELVSDGVNLMKLVATYTSANDNLVTITTTFTY